MLLREFLHQGLDAAALVWVQARGRLIEDQDRRVGDHRVGEPGALAIAARDVADQLVADIEHARALHRALDVALALLARDALQRRAVAQVFLDAKVGIQRHVLGQVADVLAHIQRLRPHIEPGDAHVARTRGVEAGEHANRRRLARPVGAEEADDFAALHFKGQAVDGRRGAELLTEVANRDHHAVAATQRAHVVHARGRSNRRWPAARGGKGP